jgi:hypothetical protein
MQKVLLTRLVNLDTGSEGAIFFQGQALPTLELPWRKNARGLSCIPAGTYLVKWWKSPSKGWCYRVYGVPNRDYILIHSANFAGDSTKGLRTDLLGCITLGKKRGVYEGQRGLFVSRPAVRFFNETMNTQDFILEVKNAESYRIPV